MIKLPLTDPGNPDTRSPLRFLLWVARLQWTTLLGGITFGVIWMVAQALMPAAMLASYAWKYWIARRERAQLRHAFSYFVPSEVVSMLEHNRGQIGDAKELVECGCVATDAAIDVSRALGTQVAKWTARATPASALNRPSRRRSPKMSAANSARRRRTATGVRAPTAIALRQNAIASAGAAA